MIVPARAIRTLVGARTCGEPAAAATSNACAGRPNAAGQRGWRWRRDVLRPRDQAALPDSDGYGLNPIPRADSTNTVVSPRQTDAWGIKVANVEIKHVDLNDSMVRAIAKQAEAERLRRARVINAEGEQQAASNRSRPARCCARQPNAMQLRYFTALNDIAGERTSTVVFPIPLDLLHMRGPGDKGSD